MQSSNLAATITLHNGIKMPRLGLGVWQCPGPVATKAVKAALALGYRHIDTAMIYGNEKEVGAAIRDSGVTREHIFVTTKLWTVDHGYDEAQRAFDASLERLGLDYVDLYLSHFPVAGKRVDAWRGMSQVLKNGRCRAIGVSNYMELHLNDIIDATGVIPTVNQVEFHPYLNQVNLLKFCQDRKIQVEAYSPLTHAKRLDDRKLVIIAERHERTPAQVLIRWGLQTGLVVIPKSQHPERIEENGAVFDFELTDGDMRVLNGLNEDLRTCWDPTDEP